MKLKKVAAGVGIALSLVAGAAHAQILSFEDDDIDFARTSTLAAKTSGALAVGDVLVTVFEIPVFTLNGGPNLVPAGTELTGIAAIQIDSFTGGGGVGTVINFAPYVGGLNAVLALGGAAPLAGCGAGSGCTIAMYLNGAPGGPGDIDLDVNRSTNPASNCTSLADCIEQATLGTLFQVDGFFGDADEFWEAVLVNAAGADVGATLALGNTVPVASVSAAQTTMFQLGYNIQGIGVNTGLPCNAAGPDCVAGPVISGTVTGGAGLSNEAFAHSDFDLVKAVPEPTTLALLGLGLLGFGATRRRSA